MAEEKEAEEGGGKSSKKLIIIIALVVVIAIGASVGVTYVLLSGPSEESSEEAAAEAVPVKQPALYMDMKPPMVVTFDQKGKQRYLQAHVSLMSRSQEALDGIELHMPVIRNRLINLYGAKDYQELQTHDARVTLQQESIEIVNKVLEEEKVTGVVEWVLFTNLVMQ